MLLRTLLSFPLKNLEGGEKKPRRKILVTAYNAPGKRKDAGKIGIKLLNNFFVHDGYVAIILCLFIFRFTQQHDILSWTLVGFITPFSMTFEIKNVVPRVFINSLYEVLKLACNIPCGSLAGNVS